MYVAGVGNPVSVHTPTGPDVGVVAVYVLPLPVTVTTTPPSGAPLADTVPPSTPSPAAICTVLITWSSPPPRVVVTTWSVKPGRETVSWYVAGVSRPATANAPSGWLVVVAATSPTTLSFTGRT